MALRFMKNQTSLYEFGYNFLGPICGRYFQALEEYINSSTPDQIVFLAREGYFFSKIYKMLLVNDLISSIPHTYLHVSRTFLFRISIGDASSWDLSLANSFDGTLKKLLLGRFGFSLSEIEDVFSSSELNTRWLLPVEAPQLCMKFKAVQNKLKHVVLQSRNTYLDYLSELGISCSKAPLFLDLGYAGTIQKLLTKLLHKNTSGLYFIATSSGEHIINGNIATMTGVYKSNVSMGDGYIMLDRSLFLESLLTAPQGQFFDISKKSEYSDSEFFFSFGRKANAQHNIHDLEVIFDGAVDTIVHIFKNNIKYSCEDIETLYEKYAFNRYMFPNSVRHLFDVDDAISGNANVNPMNLFRL